MPYFPGSLFGFPRYSPVSHWLSFFSRMFFFDFAFVKTIFSLGNRMNSKSEPNCQSRGAKINRGSYLATAEVEALAIYSTISEQSERTRFPDSSFRNEIDRRRAAASQFHFHRRLCEQTWLCANASERERKHHYNVISIPPKEVLSSFCESRFFYILGLKRAELFKKY